MSPLPLTRTIYRLILAALFWHVSLSALAIDFRKEGEFTLAPEETIDRESWMMAENATIEGPVQDDLFLLAQNISLSSDFNNDLWSMGNSILMNGHVREHARLLAAKNIEVSGQIDRNLIALAGTVKIDKESIIGGDLCLMGEHLILEGTVKGDARFIGYQATIGGHTDGDIYILADDIVILPGAEIMGNITYLSSNELVLNSQVQHDGELIRQQPASEEPAAKSASLSRRAVVNAYFYFAAILTGLLFLSIFRRHATQAVVLIRRSTWRCMLTGLIAFCIIPMLALFALFSIVGLPLGAIVGALYLMLLYFGKIIAGVALGSIILRQQGPQPLRRAFSALSTGLFLLYALSIFVDLASAIWFTSTIVGLGALVLSVMFPTTTAPMVPPTPFAASLSENPPGAQDPEADRNETTNSENR